MRGYEPFSFVVAAFDENDNPIPIGLALGISPFECVPIIGRPPVLRSFAWYLAGIPPWACEPMGVPIVSITSTIVDICRLFSLADGGNGRIVLHAASTGGERLLKFYLEKCKLRLVPRTMQIRSAMPLWRRRNDGRYLYSDGYIRNVDDDL